MPSEHDKTLREQAIRERARLLWEQRGRPTGQDLDNWLKAETQIEYEFPRSWAEVAADDAGSKVHPE